jgi:hypothetical protein
MKSDNAEAVKRMVEAIMPMNKLEISKLETAFHGG